MPELKCTVQTCRHNQNYYCDLDKITVGGDAAVAPKDTCCESFEERKDGYSHSTGKQASPVRSAWKVETPAHVGRQNVRHLIAAADKKNKCVFCDTMENPGEIFPGFFYCHDIATTLCLCG